MTKEQALQLIGQALATVRATMQEHQALQEALKVLKGEDEQADKE